MKGLGIEIHACENNGNKLMDQVVAGLMGGDVMHGGDGYDDEQSRHER